MGILRVWDIKLKYYNVSLYVTIYKEQATINFAQLVRGSAVGYKASALIT